MFVSTGHKIVAPVMQLTVGEYKTCIDELTARRARAGVVRLIRNMRGAADVVLRGAGAGSVLARRTLQATTTTKMATVGVGGTFLPDVRNLGDASGQIAPRDSPGLVQFVMGPRRSLVGAATFPGGGLQAFGSRPQRVAGVPRGALAPRAAHRAGSKAPPGPLHRKEPFAAARG